MSSEVKVDPSLQELGFDMVPEKLRNIGVSIVVRGNVHSTMECDDEPWSFRAINLLEVAHQPLPLRGVGGEVVLGGAHGKVDRAYVKGVPWRCVTPRVVAQLLHGERETLEER